MKKILLAALILGMGGNASAGPVYDLAYHVSSATLKVSGDIRVAASSSSANTPTITLSGPSGITTSKPITTSSSMTANAFYGDGSHLTGVATAIPNTFVSSVTFSSNTYTVGYSSATKYYGDGSALTGITGGGSVLSTTTVNGIPICGYIETTSTTPPTDFLYPTGQSLSTTTYASLFACLGYANGGSGANFNLPNWPGFFARAVDTTGTIDSEPRVIGSTETDKFQGHLHGLRGYTSNIVGTGYATLSSFQSTPVTITNQPGTSGILPPETDGTNGTPRTGNETRPKNIAVARHIRYQITGTTAFSNTNLVTTTATYTAPTTFSNSVTVSSLTATGTASFTSAVSTVTFEGWVDIGYRFVSITCPSAYTCTATCPAGTKVLYGGCYATVTNNMQASYPAPQSTSANSWICSYGVNSGSLGAYVGCARIK